MGRMHDLLRVWRRIEALHVTAGVDQQWRELLGDDFGLIEPYLRPEQSLATSYPCPHPIHDGCPRRVVHHGPGDIVAVCGNASPQCEPVKLSRRDIVVRTLKIHDWIAALTGGLREANGLDMLDVDTPSGVVSIGVLERRGSRLPVVWIRRALGDVENLVRGIRPTVDGDGLVAVLPSALRGQTDRPLSGDIVLLTAPETDDGDLALWRALDILDPSYRQRRVTDPLAIFDEVTVEFATVPGERHVVRINGNDFGGFQKSDVKFLRLLYLAAARASDPDTDGGGWLEKWKLQGDDKDHDIERLRKELEKYHLPDLGPDERKALIKSSPKRDGTIRLAVHPRHVRFDPSLAHLELVGERQTRGKSGKRRRTPGAADLAENLERGRHVALKLLADARKLGVPGPDSIGG
ncbi:MAG: hypothetical protein D6705_01640 [Deltaproteobacteria bacterium]|nr:MAG: hypothetical protein D6705_01640 [Deltaproteobacteria bacterium]